MIMMVKHKSPKIKDDSRPGKGKLTFKLTAGQVCLDFANTLRKRLTDHPVELLTSYAEFVAWSRMAGTITAKTAQDLLRAATQWPGEAQTVLKRAIRLREAIHRVISAVAEAHPPAADGLKTLNVELEEALAMLRVVPKGQGFAWEWGGPHDALYRVVWPVARSAAELLTSEELAAVRECEASDCAWLFMDRSKNRSRRWCDMKMCGNRAKARRHYERQIAGR